ncbi:type VII secretion integral membrane protein EccD [Mycolicibacterium flavescens]|uniref:Type VII secretion integral membrane protein EccD n=1 Tax=Mycolicibacterium flavescens TaxID=1776 RepID=A0A1E3R7L6_MYCFV|nr:type VII secretion integral membrane protein EccD [Mycolicibacterium flavescens]MCV7281979.1 type VII secretion integral membrane protein EccD [Mycolicibacterium flavescens]ODQ85824.1 type VII secretion integral membrane protein EccD [Mycolicibacterium flavescens]
MFDSLCRVSVHVDRADTAQTVDLALPSEARLGDMLPAIVDLAETGPARSGRWRLHRIDGSPLDESLTLRDNMVDDGELLWLTTEHVPEPVLVDRDPGRTVATRQSLGAIPRPVCVTLSLAAAGLGAAAIVWSARSTAATAAVVTGAALSLAAAGAAVAARRAYPTDPTLCASLGLLAAMLAAVTGAVVVPAGPLVAHVLLASAAAFAVAVILLRLNGVAVAVFTSVATASLLCAAGSAIAIVCRFDPAAAGAVLATTALAALSMAPRLAIALTRIGPAPPDPDAPEPAAVETDRAARAHEALTGMVLGASLTATAGSAVVAAATGFHNQSPLAPVAFTTVTGLALLLRTGTHGGAVRRSALAVCGSLCVTAGFVVLTVTIPHHAHWLGAIGVVTGTAGLGPLLDVRPSLAVRRAAEIAEYAVLAAAIPLACWVAGAFAVVRDLALT